MNFKISLPALPYTRIFVVIFSICGFLIVMGATANEFLTGWQALAESDARLANSFSEMDDRQEAREVNEASRNRANDIIHVNVINQIQNNKDRTALIQANFGVRLGQILDRVNSL